MNRKIVGFLGWLALCFTAAATGAFFKPGDWYAQLQKPSWTPPNALFPIIWTTLYILMAIAAWRVWKKWGFREARCALGIFLVQIVLNALWSPLFFGWHHFLWSVVDIVLLEIAIVSTMISFFRKDTVAGALLVPYALWVGIATCLNISLWRLN